MNALDKRKLGHKKPCKECPFRKNALKGYFGGHPMNSYVDPVESGLPTSCHKHDKGINDPETKLCAGALGVIKNDPNIEPWDHIKGLEEKVNSEEVFTSIAELREHHTEMHYRIYR
jgi:hypothetical protein